ncbi:3-methylcrotonyl-CoA carboxylase alpha subunit/acetyl-CoA/propionyl-CoA carboxylase, biotin carboxylase, biotin carboxyl carrier protein [Roseovarius litoreus]|uniref:3-methylcrotonyl-CoA carboxylase alpha subunit/acetyl-CoA/propionyl-CoA carboxylase, biotin carboxylase, biotin carboxyl carrier protein n=1 Tax=Roseovarius litoreus TaxID=1155722 RepID=A0A1M7EFW8_9RHOB|nr:biotin carboxylase N-terminal domain-containing protein [Roseovarius litoreus]SHL90526.1 3-methylcrotonyl-CoA carboxylase alpha subunit/acetyl-CoA/propionyl-CoA carboxylase, biotin carboxylase, biotin carboxyl carrier protein [Roseovarius litoreus]
MSFDTVLIANRGEIARRIIRACRSLGLGAVAVYSEADRDAPFVAEADLALPIGPAEAAQSYLDPHRLLDAARRAGAQAVHPGYGFLSENANFARAVVQAGLVWIGPDADVIALMGSKAAAKAEAQAAGVPILPGYRGSDQSDTTLLAEATSLGAPLLIKASAGGGGRGIRRLDDLADFPAALASARREAQAAFGNSDVLLERFLEGARHVELQVLADHHGTVLHLGDRDCSVQSNHQKLIEEAPAPDIPDSIRAAMAEAAVRLAASIGYRNAGTVEFLYDPDSYAWHFLEMNTRLQVEHPVTEAVTGLDLVAWQIRIAQGQALTLAQSDIRMSGAAIEARIALDGPGGNVVTHWDLPELPGLRLDSAIEAGSPVSHHYDPMIAKLIAHGPDRATALARLRAGLAALEVGGIGTNAAQVAMVLATPDFASARLGTDFLARHPQALPSAPTAQTQALAALALALHSARISGAQGHLGPWTNLGAWRLTALAGRGGASWHMIDGAEYAVHETAAGHEVMDIAGAVLLRAAHARLQGNTLDLEADGVRRRIAVGWSATEITLTEGLVTTRVPHGRQHTGADRGSGGTDINAPMPGLLAEILHPLGTPLKEGDPVLVFEAMKLMQTMTAPCDGILTDLPHAAGATVPSGALLARFTPDEDTGYDRHAPSDR